MNSTAMKRIVLILVVMLGVALGAHAQRPVSSTYLFNGLLINPAYAGALNLLSATVTHRDQWVNIDGAPTHQTFNAHASMYNNTIGVGLFGVHDKVGVHTNNSLYGTYAYKVRSSAGIMSFGLQGGFDSRQSDFTELTILDTGDPLLSGRVTSFKPNFGTGFLFYNQSVFLGASVPYILRNKLFNFDEGTGVSDSKERRTYYLYGGNFIRISPTVVINPSAYFRVTENAPLGYDLNLTFILQDIAYVGASFKSRDRGTLILQLVLNDNFSVGYAYDASFSALNEYTPGSHEIMINYRRKVNFTHDAQCPVYY